MAKKEKTKSVKLLQTKEAMREELSCMGDSLDMIASMSGVSLKTIQKFIDSGDISEENLLKLDKVNRM